MTLESLEPEVALALAGVAPILVADEARQTILAIAAALPAAASSHFGFESWLGERLPRLDFLFKSTPQNGGRELLTGLGPQPLPESFRDAVAWRRVQALCREWARPGSSLDERVLDVWLEFDVTEGIVAVQEPGLYIGAVDVPDAANDHRWLADEILPLLFASAVPAPVFECLRRCISALPPGARLYNVGALPSRRREFVRLCVGDLPQDGLLDFLDRAGWPGDRSRVGELLSDLAPRVDFIVLDLDLWSAIETPLGIEAYIWHQLPGHAHLWPRFTTWLAGRGLCTAPQQEALSAWPGIISARDGSWPRRYAEAEALTGNRSVLDRSLHHVKLAVREGEPLLAKAYLSVEHRWLETTARAGVGG